MTAVTEKLARLECPDCGGKLLRGPRAGRINQNLTCGTCETRFNVALVLRSGGPSPESDAEFRETAVVLAWERVGRDEGGAAFHDPTQPPRRCLYGPCREQFTGPGLYCCLACAISDA